MQFSVSNAMLLPSAAYLDECAFVSDMDQCMEEFFEVESVFCLNRSVADENILCWDNLLREDVAGRRNC